MPPVRLVIRQGPYNQMIKHPDGAVGRYIRNQLQAVEVEAKRLCPVDENGLRASSKIVMRQGPRGPEGTLTFTAPYALFVHEGTRPHWPPIQALEGWAKRHGFPNAYLVAKAIAMHGTKGTPFLWNALSAVVARARRRRP